jgi:hypothetical protein
MTDKTSAASTHAGVPALMSEFNSLWWEGDSSFPDLGPLVSPAEQRENEHKLKRVVDQVLEEIKHPPTDPEARKLSEQRLALAGREFVKATIGLDDVHLDALQHGGFIECGREFARLVHEFDPTVSREDTFQASRNVWTMNGVQRVLGLPVRMTPSVFAYSLLYPYTDNALDRPDVSEDAKLRANDRFGRRLAGEKLPPEAGDEEKLFRLLEKIETEYARATAPQVYESLYAIHDAQARSVRLMRRDEPPYGVDVLGIAIEKGGASVLADGYLVAGSLTLPQARLLFGLGALLQLGDDLQDIEDDRAKGLATIFSQTAKRWPLDRLTNRLFHFRAVVLEHLACLDAPEAAPLADLMRKATFHLVLDAAGSAPRFYSGAYIKALEAHSPFRFRELARQRRRLERERTSAFALLATAMSAGTPTSST